MRSSPDADGLVTDRLKLAMVVPRFGEQIVGGAEMHARQLAERLAACGHEVDVLTTCALDHYTWKNVLPEGVERWGDLTVRRFPAEERDTGIHASLERAIAYGRTLTRTEELLWLRHGVSSIPMEEELATHGDRYDMVLAMPYLFGTTYYAYAANPERTVIIPCLHDEPYVYLGFVREMLRGARGLMLNAYPEADLAARIAGETVPWTVVGLGFDPAREFDVDQIRAKYGLHDPFLFFVGRREGGKNTPLLIEHFLRYKERHPSDLKLVFAGSGDAVPSHPDLVDLDIDWADRDGVYRACTVFCQPSVNESLSIVLMQSWLTDRPVVVHGRCAVTRDHCERSNGGLWFTNYAEFETVLDRLLADPGLRDTLGHNGRAFVEREYSWPEVLRRFHDAAYEWLGVRAGSASS